MTLIDTWDLLILRPINWLLTTSTRLAAIRGRRERDRLKRQYPDGLSGWVGEVYLTRGKRGGWRSILDWITPITRKGYVKAEQIKAIDRSVYEVVHHAHFWGHHSEEFVLSLFPNQVDELEGYLVTIDKYACIRHPFHYLIVDDNRRTSTELYIQGLSDFISPRTMLEEAVESAKTKPFFTYEEVFGEKAP